MLMFLLHTALFLPVESSAKFGTVR